MCKGELARLDNNFYSKEITPTLVLIENCELNLLLQIVS